MFPNPNLAYCAVLAGLAVSYVEFLRPGLVAPGVAGAVLAMLGVASLSAHGIALRGVALAAAAVVLLAVDVKWRLRGAAAAVGSVLLALGARTLLAEEDARIGWPAAGASVPFLLLTWWLLQQAARARANKIDF